MKKTYISYIGTILLVVVWSALAATAWLKPSQALSEAERRPLAQFPEINTANLLNGSFMTYFEDYTLDQFPLRDGFRQVKSQFHFNVLQQKDNNDIYIADGYAAQLEYPLNETSVSNAIRKFNWIYENFLANTDSRIIFSIVPDKGYYLAEQNGYPTMDYDSMFTAMQNGLSWADHVDLTDCLTFQDYYRTDTHWRQEALLPAAEKLCQALDVSAPEAGDYIQTALDTPFYGVYYGQAALPLEPETVYTMESDLLNTCIVTNFETGKRTSIYDRSKLTSPDLYDIYLSGATALLTIENPMASTDRELIVFRDSFGSSMIPLLLQDYKTVTVVDIRYISSLLLPQHISFQGQDILFLYSTLVLNNSSTLK